MGLLLSHFISGELGEKEMAGQKIERRKATEESPVAFICSDARRSRLPALRNATIIEYGWVHAAGLIKVVDAVPAPEE